MKNFTFFFGSLFILLNQPTFCQTNEIWYENNSANTLKLKESATRPIAKISDMSWYVGRWVGEGFGGELEENFGPAMGNSMIGSFRMIQKGQPIFYEFVAIVEEDNTLAYKVKHFNPDLTGWETKDKYVSFPLVKMGEQIAWFDGMTIKRVADELTIYLVVNNDGKISEEKLTLHLATNKD